MPKVEERGLEKPRHREASPSRPEAPQNRDERSVLDCLRYHLGRSAPKGHATNLPSPADRHWATTISDPEPARKASAVKDANHGRGGNVVHGALRGHLVDR